MRPILVCLNLTISISEASTISTDEAIDLYDCCFELFFFDVTDLAATDCLLRCSLSSLAASLTAFLIASVASLSFFFLSHSAFLS